MQYLLDTNVCIDLMRGRAAAILGRLAGLDIDAAGISTITLAELRYGAAKSSRPQHHENLIVVLCSPLEIAPFDEIAAERYGTVRAELERAGTPIGPLDTLIAAHALALDVVLVTANVREFSRVKGLRIENWKK